MDKKNRLLMILLIPVIAAVILCFLFLDEFAAQLVSVLAVLILAAVIFVWSMDHSALHALLLTGGAYVVYAAVLKFFADTEFTIVLSGFYNKVIAFFCDRIGKEAPPEVGNQTALVITFWVVAFLVYVIYQIVRKQIKENTGAGSEEAAADKDFPERNYKQKRKSFCKFLSKRLDMINSDSNWSEDLFTPIDAEIEACIGRRKKRKYSDLHKCLRRYRRKKKVFLVLGDPGSGKSVSMRKLCADMLEEADKTDLIPVYVDLKKWTESWSLENPPTEEDLSRFIEQTLREGGTTYTDSFLQKYYQKMLENGKWYFIFDSFDEMPCLMGRKNCQELIDEISKMFYNFLTRENQSGGVIASRLFRAPSDSLNASVKLNIQPFSDAKIKKMLRLYTNNSNVISRALFGKREDLVSLCRNPFYLTLLIEYVLKHGANFPENQMKLYESFVQGRLKRCEGRMEEERLTMPEVSAALKTLAQFMQNSTKYGLECPAAALQRQYVRHDWEKILELLRYAKLCRYGGDSKVVSFVHRRFQEYFLVESIMEQNVQLDEESFREIENNSGLRDALVLYCEIAPLEDAKKIAMHCMSVLYRNLRTSDSILDDGCVSIVNTLYFMAEAFRNRREALEEYGEVFFRLAKLFLNSPEFYVQHAAASCMVIFEQPKMQEMVLKIMECGNRWLNDVVMKNCRAMTTISGKLSRKMAHHITRTDSHTFFRQFRDMDFSLSLSSQLWYVRLVHGLRLIYELGYYAAAVLAALLLLLNVPVLQVLSIRAGIWCSAIIILPKALSGLMMGTKAMENYFRGMAVFIITAMAEVTIAKSGLLWLYAPSTLIAVVYFGILWGWDGLCRLRKKPIREQWADLKNILKVLMKYLVQYGAKLPEYILESKELRREMLALLLLVLGRFGEKHIPKSLQTPYVYILTLLILLIVFGPDSYQYVRQRLWIRQQPPVTRLDRKVLEKNLKYLTYDSCKRRYLESLLERKVLLEGEWSKGLRPERWDDEMNRILSDLDRESKKI